MLNWRSSSDPKKHEYELVNINEDSSCQQGVCRPQATVIHENSDQDNSGGNKWYSWTTKLFIFGGCLTTVFVMVRMIMSPTTNNDDENHNNTDVKEYSPFIAPSTLNFKPGTSSGETTSKFNPSCVGNRLESGRELNVDQFLCDPQKRYMFGMDKNGSLLYINDKSNTKTRIMKGGSSIKLLKDGTLQVKNDAGKVIWKRLYLEAGVKDSLPNECLNKRDNDCPYVQLHNDGAVVLKYTDNSGTSQNRDIHRIYDIDYKSGNVLRDEFQCIGERIQNSVKLQNGLFLCDHTRRYRFGLDEQGNLIYADDVSRKTTVFFHGKKEEYSFTMLQDATFAIKNMDGKEKWSKKCKDKVKTSSKCLAKPEFDCPYLHLHSSGIIVLNYIDEKGDWQEKKVRRKYDMDFR